MMHLTCDNLHTLIGVQLSRIFQNDTHPLDMSSEFSADPAPSPAGHFQSFLPLGLFHWRIFSASTIDERPLSDIIMDNLNLTLFIRFYQSIIICWYCVGAEYSVQRISVKTSAQRFIHRTIYWSDQLAVALFCSSSHPSWCTTYYILYIYENFTFFKTTKSIIMHIKTISMFEKRPKASINRLHVYNTLKLFSTHIFPHSLRHIVVVSDALSRCTWPILEQPTDE